ncbi:uncharacterized protein GGS25DRAFT_154529 [Hypoxylon fragiforme]|uniref:uncharacterized protein n=1 Tax=Hypoxylon fragiforme TaxID=63214 RepID=UPI0020C5E41B|nr:uncharacterized protein GGS25DRAFT_154529 [Hypoxylon fragiforme]KAI2613202.1 hypothetical protein GGS25DRAFT_154529 [Hypoxylon fragiforme]
MYREVISARLLLSMDVAYFNRGIFILFMYAHYIGRFIRLRSLGPSLAILGNRAQLCAESCIPTTSSTCRLWILHTARSYPYGDLLKRVLSTSYRREPTACQLKRNHEDELGSCRFSLYAFALSQMSPSLAWVLHPQVFRRWLLPKWERRMRALPTSMSDPAIVSSSAVHLM